MKIIRLLLAIMCFAAVSTVLGQDNPAVIITLGQPTAHKGDLVTADVKILNAVNVGGADVGVTVDDQCLQIVNRTNGSFLPTTSEAGGYSPFSEMHDHDTRLAASIIDRSKLAYGSGTFYTLQLEVTCDQGRAPLTVSFAEFSSYKDPKAQQVELIAYTLGAGTIETTNAVLTIGSPQDASVANSPDGAIVASIAAPEESPVKIIIIVALAAIGIAILGIIFFVMRRRSVSEAIQD